jgi:GNAT superfamily N-acetyltransferase
MLLTRSATPADAELIAHQRLRMFADSGQATPESMQTMAANFVGWVRPRLADGRYLGWLVEDQLAEDRLAEGEKIAIAGAGLWLLDFPPHWLDPEPLRAYLLNFYVAPTHRRRGLAQKLLTLTLDEARARGVRVVTLHASTQGRPIYERNGFQSSNEMIFKG